MRGSLWTLLVAAVGGGIFLRHGVNSARPSSPSAGTQSALDVLHQLEPFAGMIVLLVGLGAFVAMTFSRGF